LICKQITIRFVRSVTESKMEVDVPETVSTAVPIELDANESSVQSDTPTTTTTTVPSTLLSTASVTPTAASTIITTAAESRPEPVTVCVTPNLSSATVEVKATPVATGIRTAPPQTSGGVSILTSANNSHNLSAPNQAPTQTTTSLGTVTASGISKSSTTASTVTSLSNSNSIASTNNGVTATKDAKLQETEKQTLLAIYKLCKKFNFRETVETFKKEVSTQQGMSEQQLIELAESADAESHVTNVLSTYKSEGDPVVYEESYGRMITFIDNALDTYRHELALMIYPVFVHMYLELVYNSHENQAVRFLNRFASHQENFYFEDIRRLAVVTKKEQMKGNEIIDNFRSGQNLFTVRLSRDSNNYLKRFLNDASNSLIQNIVHEHLYVDIYEGLTRTKQQVDAASGAMMGEAGRQANKAKVYYGLLKEPDINVQLMDDDAEDGVGPAAGQGVGGEGAGDSDRPKKKKIRKEIISKKSRNDPNAPPLNRIPLPELRDIDKLERMNALRESARRLKLGPGCLPSICFYTLLNANYSQNMAALCVDVSEDSNYIAAGFADSTIIVWPLGANKLRGMKSSSDLEMVDKEADDVMVRMMDERTKWDQKILHGHQGPVYSIDFSPDKTLLLSCSEDSTSKFHEIQRFYFIFMMYFITFGTKFACGVCKLGPTFARTKVTAFLFGM
jgi:transcription initiation factor TFIID subunit 5